MRRAQYRATVSPERSRGRRISKVRQPLLYVPSTTAAKATGRNPISYRFTVALAFPEQGKNGVTLKVYPNPAKDYAVFEIKGLKGNGKILIMNIFGETVATERATHEKTVVKLRGLDSGLYYYRVDNDVNVLSGKIVVWK